MVIPKSSRTNRLSTVPLAHPMGEGSGVRANSLPAINYQLSTLKTSPARLHRQRGSLLVELLVAMAILAGVLLPLAYSFVSERRLARSCYQRAVAMEIVDGEMEILVAGEWRNLPDGSQPYAVHAGAAANLPPGRFQLTKTGQHLRLEWTSDRRQGIGTVVREVTYK